MNASQPPPGSYQLPRRKRHWVRWTLIITAAVIAVFIITGVAASISSSSGGHGIAPKAAPASSSTATTVPAAPAAAPAPDPSPDGTYQGSCDYTLTDSLYGNDHLVGEIDLRNTGNVGVIVRTRITWPQEGSAPVTARKTVRLPFGASKPVRFSIPVSGTGNVIDLLQSWQEHHGLRDGCTYHAAFTDTFGTVHG